MVCIAAFIILALVGVFVAVVSIFKPEVGKSYLAMLKKSWGCLWKKVRLQKCETGFKDDVKNTLLSRVIVKHPTWVKPLGVVIEVVSVVIVVVVVWALITAVKSLLALWALGSCNVTKPSACSLGGEICSIDETEPRNPIEWTGRWFEEWGEILQAIPEKFRSYDMNEYDFSYITVGEMPAAGAGADDKTVGAGEVLSEEQGADEEKRPLAVDIFDPGCSVCLASYRNQKESGFFEQYETRLVPFPIQDGDGSYKFRNSELVTRYLLAAEKVEPGLAMQILDPLFTEKGENEQQYQMLFNEFYDAEQARTQLERWLERAGKTAEQIAEIRQRADGEEVTEEMARNKDIVENQLNIRGIPTIFYDGAKHTGLYKAE